MSEKELDLCEFCGNERYAFSKGTATKACCSQQFSKYLRSSSKETSGFSGRHPNLIEALAGWISAGNEDENVERKSEFLKVVDQEGIELHKKSDSDVAEYLLWMLQESRSEARLLQTKISEADKRYQEVLVIASQAQAQAKAASFAFGWYEGWLDNSIPAISESVKASMKEGLEKAKANNWYQPADAANPAQGKEVSE